MRMGIIGCGLMGAQRARAIRAVDGLQLAAVYDPDAARRERLAAEFECEAVASAEAVASSQNVDAVVVAVPHYLSFPIVSLMLQAGKHVLCEKPLGLTSTECQALIETRPRDITLATGFNYRFYPGIQQARRMIDDGKIGELTHIRGVLGHGGRPGMESEWKMSKRLCGGGALLDPGIHFLDLVRWLGGEIEHVQASLARSFWPVDVEDNAFVTLRTTAGRHAHLHISTSEWKSLFSLDFFGTDGCIRLTGRSGFYGAQVVRYNRRWEWQDPDFREQVTEYPLEDTSFRDEMRAFLHRVERRGGEGLASAQDCCRLLEVIEDVYASQPVMSAAAAVSR